MKVFEVKEWQGRYLREMSPWLGYGSRFIRNTQVVKARVVAVTLHPCAAGATGQFKVRLGSSLDFLCHLDVVEPRRRQRARMTYRLVH